MPLPLIPLLGPLLIKGLVKTLPSRIAETWAPRIGKLIALALVALLVWLAIGAIRTDARNDLLAEQAKVRRLALDAQRAREAAAAATRTKEMAAGAKADAAQQEEITNATQNLPDTRPSARQRARVCIELQQQDKAAGRPQRSC